ncbi:MAG: hypothetical protein HKM95_15910 [Inquilinus sp.]|nr:hypothetical protein [Inquilinus sp.]
MALKKIRLELARTPEFPLGSRNHGYEFVAPLTGDGHFDDNEWRGNRAKCTVRRFWPREDDELGHLVHTRHRTWAFHYDGTDPDEDEPIFKFDRHLMKEGEYVTITEHDGVARPFKMVKVAPFFG